ncbi:MAG TPA: hypothetical protein PKY05_11865, partial [Fibrobacteria bacterium]|nr:hypothetical protein [Fibrobacteria bacterium]
MIKPSQAFHDAILREFSGLDPRRLYSLLNRNGRGTIISVLCVWWLFFVQFMWLPFSVLGNPRGGISSFLGWNDGLTFFILVVLPAMFALIYPMQCDYMLMSGSYLVEYRKVTPGEVRQILNVAGNRREMERVFLGRPAKPFYFLVHSYVRGGGDDGVAMILRLDDQKISTWGWNFFFWQDAIKGASIAWPSGLIAFIGYFQFVPNENIFSGLFRGLFERPLHYLWEALHLRFSMASLASLHVLVVEAIILLGWSSFLYEFWLRRTRNFAMPEGYLLLPQPKR